LPYPHARGRRSELRRVFRTGAGLRRGASAPVPGCGSRQPCGYGGELYDIALFVVPARELGMLTVATSAARMRSTAHCGNGPNNWSSSGSGSTSRPALQFCYTMLPCGEIDHPKPECELTAQNAVAGYA